MESLTTWQAWLALGAGGIAVNRTKCWPEVYILAGEASQMQTNKEMCNVSDSGR